MAIDSTGRGGGKRRQVDGDQEGGRQGAVEETVPVDRISALPNELRQRILTCLPLKDAIRTGALARGWRDLWKSRWSHRASVEIRLRSGNDPQIQLETLEGEPRPRLHLDRFSLIAGARNLTRSQLRRFLDYAAECGVEGLHVETRHHKLNLRMPLSCPLLARLSLRRVGISNMYFYNGAQQFRALEAIRLHSVAITGHTDISEMFARCPSVRTLDLRNCRGNFVFYLIRRIGGAMSTPVNLRSVTFAKCEGDIWFGNIGVVVSSLRSFRYSGSFRDSSFHLAEEAALTDLYICLDESLSDVDPADDDYLTDEFYECLPNDLSSLTVLTSSSYVLQIASSAQEAKLSNLQGLRELQLLMFGMKAINLAHIYAFLKTRPCPKLERLFVQLPTSNDEPMEDLLDEVRKEPPVDGLDNLMTVKIMNFSWRRFEVQLVCFLLRTASSLHKLLLVSSHVAPLNVPGIQQADLLLLQEALTNGKIILRESDAAAIQPFHSEVFLEV